MQIFYAVLTEKKVFAFLIFLLKTAWAVFPTVNVVLTQAGSQKWEFILKLHFFF